MRTSSLYALFERSATRFPSRNALVTAAGAISYSDLRARAEKIADRLTGLSHGAPIAVWMRPAMDTIATVLGILKSGAPYLPIDAESPPARALKMLTQSQSPVVVLDETTSSHLDRLKKNVTTLTSAIILGEKLRVETWAKSPPPLETSLAYILYTSGSTGDPKGVAISHESAVDFVEWAVAYFKLTEQDRLTHLNPLHFDLSILDLFAAFRAGASVHFIEDSERRSPKLFFERIKKDQITFLFGVPTFFSYACRTSTIPPEPMASVRIVAWCGEPFHPPDLATWMRALPNRLFCNLYGPTETSVAVTAETFTEPPRGNEPLNIGHERAGVGALVLDAHDQPIAEAGIEGELCIGGPCVMQGYWRDPARTEKAFVEIHGRRYYRTGDRALRGTAGKWILRGRLDDQVKIRGYRIELGEIEHAALKCNGVTEACAVSAEGRLALFYSSTAELAESALTQCFADLLPRYMRPEILVKRPSLPRLPNGKRDRATLAREAAGQS